MNDEEVPKLRELPLRAVSSIGAARKLADEFLGWHATVVLWDDDLEYPIKRGFIRRWDAHYMILELYSEKAKAKHAHIAINHDQIAQIFLQHDDEDRKITVEKAAAVKQNRSRSRSRTRKGK